MDMKVTNESCNELEYNLDLIITFFRDHKHGYYIGSSADLLMDVAEAKSQANHLLHRRKLRAAHDELLEVQHLLEPHMINFARAVAAWYLQVETDVYFSGLDPEDLTVWHGTYELLTYELAQQYPNIFCLRALVMRLEQMFTKSLHVNDVDRTHRKIRRVIEAHSGETPVFGQQFAPRHTQHAAPAKVAVAA